MHGEKRQMTCLIDSKKNKAPIDEHRLGPCIFLTDLQTTKNDPGSQYSSTGDPGSVLVPRQAKITKSERHFSVYITKS